MVSITLCQVADAEINAMENRLKRRIEEGSPVRHSVAEWAGTTRRFDMPRRDGTGPMGTGSMAGKGAGRCATGNRSDMGGSGAGRGTGKGTGRGMCGWFNASELAGRSAEENESRALMEQADALRLQLDQINAKLNSIKK